MPLAEITAALGGLKAASDIIRAVSSADKALALSDLKMRLADAQTAVADARHGLLDVQESVDQKDAEIRRLNEALANRTKVMKVQDAYYAIDAQEAAVGDPFCMRCFEADHKLFHLSFSAFTNEPNTCQVCKAKYTRGLTPRKAAAHEGV